MSASLFSSQKCTALVAAAAGLMLSGSAWSATIVSDGFSGPQNLSIHGRAPDTANLPGGTYANRDYFGQTSTRIDAATGNPAPSAIVGANNLSFLPISSSGTYVKPTTFTVSADIRLVNNLSGNPGEFYDIGFAFGDPGTGDGNHAGSQNGVNAIRFTTTGDLAVKTTNAASNGGTENVALIHSYDAGQLGALDATQYYHVSYDVSTTTGDISNITLASATGSVTYDVSTSTFTDAATNYLAFASGSGTVNTFGHIDNLLLTSVPEPTTIAGLLLLSGGFLARRRRA